MHFWSLIVYRITTLCCVAFFMCLFRKRSTSWSLKFVLRESIIMLCWSSQSLRYLLTQLIEILDCSYLYCESLLKMWAATPETCNVVHVFAVDYHGDLQLRFAHWGGNCQWLCHQSLFFESTSCAKDFNRRSENEKEGAKVSRAFSKLVSLFFQGGNNLIRLFL